MTSLNFQQPWFLASLLANLFLLALVAVVVTRGRAHVINEKLATFAGCLNAITTSLSWESFDDRLIKVSDTLFSLRGQAAEAEKIELLFAKSCYLRNFRAFCLADLTEHSRLLALQVVAPNDAAADQIIEYADNPETGTDGCPIEPSDKFGSDVIARAQFETEVQILQRYEVMVRKMVPKYL